MKNPFQKKIGLVLSGALALGLAGTCTAMAQTGPDRVTEQYKAWTVTCATQAAATEGGQGSAKRWRRIAVHCGLWAGRCRSGGHNHRAVWR